MSQLLLNPECVLSPMQWNTTAPPPLIVGHITFNAAVSGTDADFRSLDVTPYLVAGGPAIKTFMIVSLRPLCCGWVRRQKEVPFALPMRGMHCRSEQWPAAVTACHTWVMRFVA